MIKMQDQKTEQKKNRYVKHNDKVQKAKKIGAGVAGAAVVIAGGAAKFGKDIVKYAPQVAKVAADAAKAVIKL